MHPTKSHTAPRRRGFTLVELTAATAIMAVLSTSSFVLVRTAHRAWARHRNDSEQRQQAIFALQHLVRQARQATRVTAISASNNNSGAVTLLMPSGAAATWDHDSGTNQIGYGVGAPTNLLASGITEMTLTGLSADGLTPTTDPHLIHSIRCTLKYSLDRPTGSVTETASSSAWLRSW